MRNEGSYGERLAVGHLTVTDAHLRRIIDAVPVVAGVQPPRRLKRDVAPFAAIGSRARNSERRVLPT